MPVSNVLFSGILSLVYLGASGSRTREPILVFVLLANVPGKVSGSASAGKHPSALSA
jgi:hypothetical protein